VRTARSVPSLFQSASITLSRSSRTEPHRAGFGEPTDWGPEIEDAPKRKTISPEREMACRSALRLSGCDSKVSVRTEKSEAARR